jgi:DNA phosphorothioation-associated putative methyltransferase
MIPRHRTAIGRNALSKPLRYAINDGILAPGLTLFDYGCGRGSDVARLREAGFSCLGWDPLYAPDASHQPSDVVNLGYVVNVIEGDAERREALITAWALTQRTLIVTARLKFEELGQDLKPFADGYLTTRGTFQKFYNHSELRDWIIEALGTDPIPAAPGMYYVFRDEAARESFLASRQRRHTAALRPTSAERLFDEHRGLFDAVLPFFSERGRLPSVMECSAAAQLYEAIPRIGTVLRALRRAVSPDAFDRIVFDRSQDLLVYLGLARFGKRPQLHKLPDDLQLDIRSFFRSYDAACAEADKLLFAVGRRLTLETAFSEATVGKLTGSALYVHVSAISRLPTLLRLYEGCARSYVGIVEGATIAKLHRLKPQISYLAYPRFDVDPHPALLGSFVVDLQSLSSRYIDYGTSADPPVLHRKELFVDSTYPRRELFAKLTAAEDRHGLLSDSAPIGTRRAWEQVLQVHGFTLRGHRLSKSRPTEVPPSAV